MMASAAGSGAAEGMGDGAGRAGGAIGFASAGDGGRAEIRPIFTAHWMRGFTGGLLESEGPPFRSGPCWRLVSGDAS
jgi:hypothetical protein